MTPDDDTDTDCCSPDPRGASSGNAALCPSCGRRGKPVESVTIESLVSEEARARAGGAHGFRFCAEPGCDVAYFLPESGERILRGEVRVAIGQKETSPERTVCMREKRCKRSAAPCSS